MNGSSVFNDAVISVAVGEGAGKGEGVSVSAGRPVGMGEAGRGGVGVGAGLIEQETVRSRVNADKTGNAIGAGCAVFQKKSDLDFKFDCAGVGFGAIGIIQAGIEGKLAAGLRAADVQGEDVFVIPGFDDVGRGNFLAVGVGQGDFDVGAFLERGDFDVDARAERAVIMHRFGAQLEKTHFLGREGGAFSVIGKFGEEEFQVQVVRHGVIIQRSAVFFQLLSWRSARFLGDFSQVS